MSNSQAENPTVKRPMVITDGNPISGFETNHDFRPVFENVDPVAPDDDDAPPDADEAPDAAGDAPAANRGQSDPAIEPPADPDPAPPPQSGPVGVV